MTDWRRILLAADQGTEVAAERASSASSMKETRRYQRFNARLELLAEFALLAIEFNHDC